MNKLDYYIDKVEELERRFLSVNNVHDPTKVSQYTLSFKDEYFVGEKRITSPDFFGQIGHPLVFQVKLDAEFVSNEEVLLSLSYGGFEVFSEQYLLNAGQQSIFVMQSVNCISETPQPLILTIKCQSKTAHKILSVDYFVWGVAKTSEGKVLLSSSRFGDLFAISMVSNKQLFLCQYLEMPEEISLSDLKYKIPALDASLTYNIEDKQVVLHIFRVDSLGNLNHSTYDSLFNEKLIDSNVSAVCSEKVFGGEQIMVAYIKNQKPFARIFDNGGFSQPIEIPIPKSAVCKRISIFKNVGQQVFVIVTTDSGANYVCMSEKELSSAVENIKVKLSVEIF